MIFQKSAFRPRVSSDSLLRTGGGQTRWLQSVSLMPKTRKEIDHYKKENTNDIGVMGSVKMTSLRIPGTLSYVEQWLTNMTSQRRHLVVALVPGIPNDVLGRHYVEKVPENQNLEK